MRSFLRRTFFVLWAAALLFAPAARAGDFPLRDGDIIVMAGDSITAQHLHSNYIEAYCVTRFPKWNLQFRNSGVSGDTVPRVLARLDVDAFCWKPTVVTIELGMNDSGPGPKSVEPYIAQMETLIGRIRNAGARPIFLTASPVNDGTTSTALKGRDLPLDQMATAIVALAAKEKIPCADQFHTLLDLWGNNMKAEKSVPLGGDGIHPGPVGQLTMAYACLAGLDAPGLVSSVTIVWPTGRVVSAKNCALKDSKIAGGNNIFFSFERTDECLPMPIPADARNALKLVPLSAKLNQYLLTLQWESDYSPPENWDVSIDGKKVATVSDEVLEKGWNMSELTEGPIADQCQAVLKLIEKKETAVSAYREAAKWKAPAWLANDPTVDVAGKQKAELDRLMKNVLAASAEINAAAQPKPHHFEIAPAK